MISRHRIRFKDCDPLGHLYNSRYLDYLLEAREDHILEHYEMDLEKYATDEGRAWVVVNHEISYFKEAKRNEYVKIRSAMISLNEKSILNEYQMWNDNMTQLKCLMWTRFLHIDIRDKKVVNHDKEMMIRLEAILETLSEKNFKNRCLQISKQAFNLETMK
ncbi:MAG: acyl-CoA thioesterase [Saprospiraceae bacterium]|nr:acyl-CoA thioesterase [Saprospiraceae bacterium]